MRQQRMAQNVNPMKKQVSWVRLRIGLGAKHSHRDLGRNAACQCLY